MLYVILVSHGEFAPGLHTAVRMIAGDRKNVLSVSLKDGMSCDSYAENFQKLTADITKEDKIVLLADIIGGSPLTAALKVLNDRGLLAAVRAFGGMNLPLALSVILNEDASAGSSPARMLDEARNAIQEFSLADNEADEEDI